MRCGFPTKHEITCACHWKNVGMIAKENTEYPKQTTQAQGCQGRVPICEFQQRAITKKDEAPCRSTKHPNLDVAGSPIDHIEEVTNPSHVSGSLFCTVKCHAFKMDTKKLHGNVQIPKANAQLDIVQSDLPWCLIFGNDWQKQRHKWQGYHHYWGMGMGQSIMRSDPRNWDVQIQHGHSIWVWINF